MQFRFLLLSLFIAVITFSISPITVKAMGVSLNDISVDMIPSYPAPLEDVSISLSSYSANMDTANITWSVDGKKLLSGIGKKSFSLKAGSAGSVTDVSIDMTFPEGIVSTKVSIRPSVMVLLWQATDSYVPPFYKGKAMPSKESEVKIVAMPEVKNTNPINLIYSWKKDYTNEADASGYGKNYFTYINDYLENSNNINVTASTLDQSYTSNASLDIDTATPKIIFYKNDSDVGTVWENALKNNHQVKGNEVIEASPYFISPKELLNPSLMWTWSINDALVNIVGFRKNLLPVAVQNGISGTSRIKLEVENKDKIFETASKEINVNY